jgi:multiple sugar transport system substrate-binding protein
MFQKRLVSILVLVALVIALSATTSISRAQDKVKLTMLTHWTEETLLKQEQALIDEYQKANPNVTIELQTVAFDQLLTKIVTGRTGGTSPDIYHFYNLWMPEFVTSGALATPPDDLIDAVKKNTPSGVQQGVTVNGKIWGYPTEVNTYLLIYNKKFLKEAGFDNPPKTWDELKKMAPAITKKDSSGAITRAGFAVIPGWDSGMVHPFAALLFANGGDYLSKDFTTAAFNSPQGVETLQLYLDLLKSGGMDMSINGLNDFPTGKVGMVIMANWWKATLAAAKDIDFKNDVGVAEIPVGPSGKQTSTISYNWLLGVDAKSAHPKEAWDFIRWLNTPRAEGKGSPMGDYLVHALGAIPSSLFDQKAFESDLTDAFETPYVKSTTYARPEPVVAGGQEIKTKLQTEIEAVLASGGDPKKTLDAVAAEANNILKEKAQAK